MGARGFTLIELLISITIIGVLLVLVMGAFRIGINAWEKGEADIETYQRQQIILQLVKEQLASIHPAAIRMEDTDPYYFKGNEQVVEFITNVSIVPGNRHGMVFVKYRIRETGAGEGKTLEIYEADLATAAADKSVFEPMDEAYHTLAEDMAEIRFEYLINEQEQEAYALPEWHQFWEPEDTEDELPSAVRLTLRAEKDMPAVRVVGRIVPELLDR